MPSLYELTAEYRADVAKLQNLDLDPETVLDTIDGMQGELSEKIKAVLIVALEMKANGEQRKDAAKRMAESGAAEVNRGDALFSYAQIAIQNSGLTLPIRYTEFTVNLQKNPPSCTVTSEEELPPSMKHTTVTYTVVGDPAELLSTVEAAHKAGVMKGVIAVSAPAVSVRADKKVVLDALKEIAAVNATKPKDEKPDRLPGAYMNPTGYRITIK